MRWPRRRQRPVDPPPAEDRATRQFRELATQWQAEERQAAARRALTEPTQHVPMELPLMTLAAQWRADGGGAR